MKIVYFAWVRETVGRAEEDATPPSDVRTVADLIAWLAARGGGYGRAFADAERLRAAVNHDHVKLDHAIALGDEVAFFPPVTGGTARRDRKRARARP